MNYTIKKQSVIFELPLSGYLGKNWSSKESKVINNLQEKEESLYDIDLNFYPYIEIDDSEIDEAKAYFLTKGFTSEELDLFSNTLRNDIHRAKNSAKESSYIDEWMIKYRRYTQERIDSDLQDNIGSISFKLLDRLDDEDYYKNGRGESDHLRLEISKRDILKSLDKKILLDEAMIEEYIDSTLDFERKEIDIEYIDRYGTLGDFDGWLDRLKDYNELEEEIEKYRKDEADKIDNAERASLELKESLDGINRYCAKYFTKHETRERIARQVTALKSVIKNAI